VKGVMLGLTGAAPGPTGDTFSTWLNSSVVAARLADVCWLPGVRCSWVLMGVITSKSGRPCMPDTPGDPTLCDPRRESCGSTYAHQRERRLMDVGRLLDAAEAAPPVEAVEAVTRELGVAIGATEVSFLIMDLSGRALVRLAHVPLVPVVAGRDEPAGPGPVGRRQDEESATELAFDGGPAEQAVRTQTVRVMRCAAKGGGLVGAERWQVLAPVTERGEVLGLLELTLPAEPDTAAIDDIGHLAHLLGFVVIANRRHTDLYEWGQRGRDLSLSAEIQQRLLPGPRTCEAGAFTLSGWLEPAADIAGDTFDYSLSRDVLHVTVTDAMGHGVGAALTATLCVGGLRGARRQGVSLLRQVASANEALGEHAASMGAEDFVTGLLGRLDLRTGSLDLVNAGHVPPYVATGEDVLTLDLPVDPPLGLFVATVYRATPLTLSPGDRVVLVTDGMLERNAAGVDLAKAISETRGLHPREAVRVLADKALLATGHALSDDATVLCLDWHGGHGDERNAFSGADQSRASRPLRSSARVWTTPPARPPRGEHGG
jgi:serine phosphatase RsbU (regulator of sigma subunit)